MKKRKYEKPSIEVVVLKQQQQLLAGSGVKSMRSGYGEAQEDEWE
jgi:hypothetical protein